MAPWVAPGLQLLHAVREGRLLPQETYKGLVLFLTFICYMCFHLSRKPPSIVKSVLDSPKAGEGWHPFDGPNGKALLGDCDLAFLASYAIGMFFSGHLGDRLELRTFLTVGMIGSGLFVGLFGMGYFWEIHTMWFFVPVQVAAGLFQSTGWPSVVSTVANWFGKGKRGLIMGVWNAHTSVGNIVGAVVAASCLGWGWGWSFVVPGAMIAAAGVLIFLFLPIKPEDLGLPSPYAHHGHTHPHPAAAPDGTLGVPIFDSAARWGTGAATDSESGSDAGEALGGSGGEERGAGGGGGRGGDKPLSLLEAWQIPGVATFALTLFFSKLVAYTFLYWLPYYVSVTPIGGRVLTPEQSGDLSTLFDVGGVVGGALAGFISDHLGASAIVASGFVYSCIPVMYLFSRFGHITLPLTSLLMFLSGLVVNGPYALITTSVSADLGTHESLMGNARALATVTAIIDGTGSIGAALGPLLTGYIAQFGWDRVFGMLYTAALCAGLLLTRLVAAEVARMRRAEEQEGGAGADGPGGEEERETRGLLEPEVLPPAGGGVA